MTICLVCCVACGWYVHKYDLQSHSVLFRNHRMLYRWNQKAQEHRKDLHASFVETREQALGVFSIAGACLEGVGRFGGFAACMVVASTH